MQECFAAFISSLSQLSVHIGTFLFFIIPLTCHSRVADNCPIPALSIGRELLLSPSCQQSCLYEHYKDTSSKHQWN